MKAWLLVILLPLQAFAGVDLREGSFLETVTDVSVGGQGYELKIQRSYNSRSKFAGMFGYGWCSEYEARVQWTPEGTLRLELCGDGQSVTYRRSDDRDSEARILKIAEQLGKAGGPALVERLQRDGSLRARMAQAAGLKPAGPRPGRLISVKAGETDTMQFDGGSFTRTFAGGQQKYSPTGKLESATDRNGNRLGFVYDGNRLLQIGDLAGRRLKFEYPPTGGRVKAVAADGLARVTYRFEDDRLVQVSHEGQPQLGYVYTYDTRKNLISISGGARPTRAIGYEAGADRVRSFTDGTGCTDNFNYEFPTGEQFSVTSERACAGKPLAKERRDFHYSRTVAGRKALASSEYAGAASRRKTEYDPSRGLVQSDTRNGLTTKFAYNGDGQLVSRQSKAEQWLLSYDAKSRKVTGVQRSDFDRRGRVIRKITSAYSYDPRGNLAGIKRSDGATLRIQYDTAGRIARLQDSGANKIAIAYDARTGRPRTIDHNGTARLDFTYDESGKPTKPGARPAVAARVAAVFAKFMDLLNSAQRAAR